jgi:RNA polymerase sigma-70 factor (ECF subfamily)
MSVKDARDEHKTRDYKSLKDVELIRLFIYDDRRAFDEFYNRYYSGLLRFVMSYCRDISVAEDIVQDTFMKLLSLKVRLGLVENIKSYMYSIALNRCRDLKRAVRDDTNLPDYERLEMSSESDKMETKIDLKILERMYDRLLGMQREVLLLRIKSGLSFKEISDVLHISENSAKVNYFYAVTTLKRLMEGGKR